MSVLDRNPSNPNPLQSNKFTLNFSRIPNVQYFCQSVSIPGISLSETVITNPFVDIYAPGEKAIYDLMNVTFIIDEELKGWKEIHDWIRAMTFPHDYDEYNQLGRMSKPAAGKITKQPQYSDGQVTLYSSSNKPYYRFKFYDCFPTTLSTFVMSATDSPDNIMTADVTFRYNYYDIEKLF